jgi:hypothetical protein
VPLTVKYLILGVLLKHKICRNKRISKMEDHIFLGSVPDCHAEGLMFETDKFQYVFSTCLLALHC